MAAPLAPDQEVDLRIDSLAYGGNGVARLKKVKRNHAEAVAVDVLEAGPARVDAPCAHFPACGGCRFQDLAYAAQLEQKQAQVEDALRRIGGIAEPPLEPIVPCRPEIFHYRNKLE